MDVKMNKCDTCTHYQPRIMIRTLMSLAKQRGKETAVYLCPCCRSKNEDMQEVANKDAFYGEALND
ncbi:MAG: hypothetical protein J6S49_08445 [Erysipelotrichaceae bacterium]|nr:hypothetical protein [Erysipelotrichaceae bacterium]